MLLLLYGHTDKRPPRYKKGTEQITAQIQFLKRYPAKTGLPPEKLNALIAKYNRGKKPPKFEA